jgi:hypothetical protein
MKKQINPNVKAYPVRAALYLLLLIAICAIPFALAQSRSRGTKQGVGKPAVKLKVTHAQHSLRSSPAGLCSNYTTSTSTDSIVPGDTDTGNHCDDCTTAIMLPFPVSLYGISYTTANVSSNGNLQFDSSASDFDSFCLYPNPTFGATVFAYQDDLQTDIGLSGCTTWANGCGVFTATTGTAPNRTFYIEWHAVHYADNNAAADFEIAFYESDPTFFDIFYKATSDNGSGEGSGVQASGFGPATNFSCLSPTLTDGLKVTYSCGGFCDSGTIQNGGFETGDFTSWVILDQNATPVVTDKQAHSGTFSGFVGDAPNGYCGFPCLDCEADGDSSFFQEFGPVPAGATLSFWHLDCTTDSIVFDWQDAYITDTSGNILQTIFHQCDDTAGTWVNTVVSLAPYEGQTIRVKFLVHEDAFGDLTGMFVDDAEVTVPCPSPTPTPAGCVYGQGYWKNHPSAWPATELQLGNVTYTQQQLLDILHEPIRGNGLISLAHHLIATKLNVANGADPSCIEQTIADADAMIGDLVVPPVGTGYLAPRDVEALKDTLEDYNEGRLCAPSCEQTSPPPAPRPGARPAPRPTP